MNPKQNPLWIILCAAVCVCVAVAVLNCLPAWTGMGDMSAFEAIVYTVKQWFAR